MSLSKEQLKSVIEASRNMSVQELLDILRPEDLKGVSIMALKGELLRGENIWDVYFDVKSHDVDEPKGVSYRKNRGAYTKFVGVDLDSIVPALKELVGDNFHGVDYMMYVDDLRDEYSH